MLKHYAVVAIYVWSLLCCLANGFSMLHAKQLQIVRAGMVVLVGYVGS